MVAAERKVMLYLSTQDKQVRTPRACYRVTGIILESVLEGYAKYYSTNLAEIVVRGQTENILKSRCNGGRETFGYTLD